jgi:hypothetical protein
MPRIRSLLADAGLVGRPLVPHPFERSLHLLSHPTSGGPSVATVPHVATPISSSERCARERCGRPPNDPIHRIDGD